MGNETSRAPRLMPSRDELDNILDQSLHQSIKLDDQYDDIHSILLASSTYHQAINQSKSPTVYQDYVGPLIRSIDDFLADSSIRSLRQSHHQSIKLPVFDLPKDTPINSLAALATDVYAADHNANSRDASSINASISMQSDQSPTYQSCRERISLARKYLILQAIIKQSTKASVQLIKSNLRTNNQSFQAKSRNSIGGAPTNQSNAQFMSLLSKVERARQSVEWLMRDLAINQAIHQAHEMMRILVGIHSHTLYSYPRALGIVSSNKPINRSSVTPASNITRPSPGSPISFHNHVTFTFGVPSTQPTSPTSKSNIHVPFTSASLSSINSPISTSHQGAHLPQYWIEQLNQRIASLDRAAQTNELVALLGALNGGLDDTFVVSLDNLSINLSNNQSIHQSIQESGMSARLSGLLSLSHRRSLNTSDFRRALINMINRYTTINQAINQLQVETVKLYNESINHSNRSSTYNHSVFQAINRNQRQINQMLAESMIEKRAMRDLFKFFHQSVAQFIVSDLSQAINQSANQPINHSINLSTLYSDLQRVDRACSNLFGSINQSEVPPITFSLSGGLGRNSSSHVGHSANIPDASPAQVTVHYDRERHAAFEEFADDKRLPHPLLDFDDDCKEIFEMKSNRSLHNDAGFRLDKVRSRSPSADQLPSVEEIARINNYGVMGQQPAASSFEEKEQHDELKESYSHPVEQKPLPAVVESVLLDSQPINQLINQPVNLPVNQSSSYVEPTRRSPQPHSRLDLPSFEEPVVHEAPSEAAPLNLDVVEPTAQSVSEPAAVEPVPEAVHPPVTDAVLPPVLPPRPSMKALSIVSSPPLHQAVEAQSHNRSFSSPTALSITCIPLDSPRPLPPIPPRRISSKSIGVQKVVIDQPESVDRPVTASPDQPSVDVMSNHVSQQNPSPSSQIGSRYHTPQPIDTERDAIESTNHAATHPSDFLPPLIVSSSEMEPHHSINGSSHLDISPVSQDHQSFGQSLNYSAHHSEMMQDPVSYGSLSPQIEDDDHINEPVEAPVQPIAKPAIAPMFPPPRPALVLSEIPRSIHSRLTDQSCNQSIKQPINSPVKIPVFSPVRPALPAELASRFIQPSRQSVGQSNGEEKVLGHEHPANSNKQSTHQSMYSPSSINWDLSPATKQMLARSNAIENVKPSNKPSAAVSPLTDNSKHQPAELSINQSNTSSSNQPKFFPPAPTPVSHYNQILHTASRRQSFDEV